MTTSISASKRAAIIDEFGELERQVKDFKPVADRYKQRKSEISAWYDSDQAGQSFEAEGKLYAVQVGPRAKERKIFAMSKLFDILKRALFLEHARFPLAEIDKHVPLAMHPAILTEERTGSRSVTAVAKQPVVVAPLKKAA